MASRENWREGSEDVRSGQVVRVDDGFAVAAEESDMRTHAKGVASGFGAGMHKTALRTWLAVTSGQHSLLRGCRW